MGSYASCEQQLSGKARCPACRDLGDPWEAGWAQGHPRIVRGPLVPQEAEIGLSPPTGNKGHMPNETQLSMQERASRAPRDTTSGRDTAACPLVTVMALP